MTEGKEPTYFTGKMSISTTAHGRLPPSPQVAVVDACAFGRLGMLRGLLQPAMTPSPSGVSAFASLEGALQAGARVTARQGEAAASCCLVVRLSPWPAQAVAQLLQLEATRLARAGIQRVVVLSPFSVNNAVRQVLVCGAVRIPLRLVDTRCSVMWLRRVVLAQGTLLQEGRDELLPHMPAMVLSPPERRVLLTTLQEIPIHQQALRQHRNHKTLYAQRKNALKKLRATGLSGLLRRFSAM